MINLEKTTQRSSHQSIEKAIQSNRWNLYIDALRHLGYTLEVVDSVVNTFYVKTTAKLVKEKDE